MSRSEEQIKQSFELFDADEDGLLDYEEFKLAVYSLGIITSYKTIEEVFQRDSTQQKMDYSKFKESYNVLNKVSYGEEEAKEAFAILDRKNKGFIAATELKRILMTMGDQMSETAVDSLLLAIGTDDQGIVKMDDLVAKLISVYNKTE